MLIRLYKSKSDIENLSRFKTSVSAAPDNFNYKKKVVNKPWGYEYLMFENENVAIWIMFLNYKHSTSMHCHPNKRTSLIILFGRAICSTLEGWIEREVGDALIIDEAVFHSTKAISKRGILVMEIESPPNKRDLVRLKDQYGRENQEYEGFEKMSRDISKYQYCDFHGDNFLNNPFKIIGSCHVSINTFNKKGLDFGQKLKKENGDFICLLDGQISNRDKEILLTAGDTAILPEIKNYSPIFALDDIMYLIINANGLKKNKSF